MATEKRLIDANEALRMIRNSKKDNPYSGTLCGVAWELAHDCAISCVEADACTVDAVEVVHGRWEPRKDVPGFVCCSVCHDCNIYDDWADGKKWNYCPNCGAKMDGDGNG